MTAFSVLAVLASPLLWVAQVGATTLTFPATVEVDLIFPRNETYAPSPFFPIVFAIQNPALAPRLWGFNLDLIIDDPTDDNITGTGPTIYPDWADLNISGSNPVFVYAFVTTSEITDGLAETAHDLFWFFNERNCSNKNGSFSQDRGWPTQYGRAGFTIQNGAQQADFVATMANNTLCANRSHLALNLTGTVADPKDVANLCAFLSDERPLVPGNPCAVQVSSATASSIMAAMTRTACSPDYNISGVSCPPNNGASAPGPNTGHTFLQGGVMAGLIAAAVATIQYL